MNALTLFIVLQMGILAVLDVLVPNIPSLGAVGLTYWSLLWITLAGFSLLCLFRTTQLLIAGRFILTAFVTVIFLGLVLVAATDTRNLSGETTREIGCVLTHLTAARDKGFSQTCHLGYPARQFLLPAAPTLVFGRTYEALQFGNIAYFVLGFIVFLRGMIGFLMHTKDADMKLATVLSFLLHFYLMLYIVLTFEQAVYPISLAFYSVGLWLIWYRKKTSALLLMLGLIQLALIHLYTPALAVVFLNMALFSYFAYEAFKKRPRSTLLLVSVLLVTSISLVISIRTRTDIRITTNASSPATIQSVGAVFTDMWRHIVYRTGSIPWISAVFSLPFLMIFVLSLIGALGTVASILATWMLSVMFIAVFAHGYASGSVDYKLQRAIVIIPYFLLIAAEGAKRIHVSKSVLTSIVILLLVSGVGTFREVQLRKTDVHQVQLSAYLQPRIQPQGTSDKLGTIYLSSDILPFVKADNFGDITPYFLPSWHAQMVGTMDESCRLTEGVWVFLATDECAKRVVAAPTKLTVTHLGILPLSNITQPLNHSALVIYRVER